MIFNRTKEDVELAAKIVQEKIRAFLPTTEEENEILSRGVLGTEALNRIETAQEGLFEKLKSWGYWGNFSKNKTWKNGDFFTKEDFERILENIEKARTAFFAKKDTPAVPSAVYHYSAFNDIEKNIYDLNDLFEDMVENVKECGNAMCGG